MGQLKLPQYQLSRDLCGQGGFGSVPADPGPGQQGQGAPYRCRWWAAVDRPVGTSHHSGAAARVAGHCLLHPGEPGPDLGVFQHLLEGVAALCRHRRRQGVSDAAGGRGGGACLSAAALRSDAADTV